MGRLAACPRFPSAIQSTCTKVKTLDIPGGDGVIDASQALTGYPMYQNRTGSIEFIVMNDFKPWHMAYSDIMDYLHGQTMRAILEDDRRYFLRRSLHSERLEVGKGLVAARHRLRCRPYKWKKPFLHRQLAVGPVQLFKMESFRAALFRNIAVTTEMKEIELDAVMYGRAPVCPRFIVAKQ